MDDERREGTPLAGADRVEFKVTRHDGTEVELPLRLLVVGDFTGRPDPAEVAARPLVSVDRESFKAVMREHALALDLEVPDVLDLASPGSASTSKVSLRIRGLADFEPEAIARQVPALASLIALRNAVTALKGPLGGEKALRRKIAQLVDDPVTRRRLAVECGVTLDDGSLARAREECAAARDEARATADPARLAVLARHPSVRVRRAVAANAAIDAATAEQLPGSALEHLLSNPHLLARGQADPRRSLSGHAIHLEWSEPVAEYFADRWGGWNQSWFHLFGYLVMEMPLADGAPGPARSRSVADRLDRWPVAEVHSLVPSTYCQLPGRELTRLLDARREMVPRERPEDALRHVASHYPWHWRSLVERPECPRDVLETLARAPQILVREAVTRHAATPGDVLRGLLADPDITVREAAHVRAGLPFVTTHLTERGGGDSELTLRALKALLTARLPERDLAATPSPAAARSGAEQTWCQRLFDRRWRVRQRAGAVRSTAAEMWSHWRANRDAADVLVDPGCPERILAETARHPSETVQLLAAIHPNASDALLHDFATRARQGGSYFMAFVETAVRRAAITQLAVPAHLRVDGCAPRSPGET